MQTWGSTLFAKVKISLTKEYNFVLKIINQHSKICTMDYPKFIVTNQKEESISIQKVDNYDGEHRNSVGRDSDR